MCSAHLGWREGGSRHRVKGSSHMGGQLQVVCACCCQTIRNPPTLTCKHQGRASLHVSLVQGARSWVECIGQCP
jgi:hypothetical protein